MYGQVETGPLYDRAVQLMSTYRSVAARMQNAKARTQAKSEKRLEALSEAIAEKLGELTEIERMALDCWKHGVVPGTYEIDHDAITAKPYASIRKTERWTEVIDRTQEHEAMKDTGGNGDSEKLRGLLKSFQDDIDSL